MPKLTIIMQGVSLTYQKSGVWKTIFPFDDEGCHKVRFFSSDTGFDVELAAPKQQIVVASKDAGTATQPGILFEKFLDLTSDYMHDRIQMKSGWEDHAVMVMMENAVLSQHEATLSRYLVKSPTGGQTKGHDFIGYSTEARIEAAEITIEVPGIPGFPLEITDDTTLTIDNECYQGVYDENGDLALLYEYVVEDPVDPGRRFTIDRYGPDKPSGLNPMFMAQPMAMTNNPERGEPGLPCNSWMASMSDELD